MSEHRGDLRIKETDMSSVFNGRLKTSDVCDRDITVPWQGRVKITPVQAAQWLAVNHGNRRPRQALIEYLCRQIASGEWQSDHPQPIVFSTAGRLIDGQHRLSAISISGETLECNVIFGARDELRQYLDTGISRTLEDRIALVDDPQMNKHVCAIVNLLWCMARGRITRPSPEDAKEVFSSNEDGLMFGAECLRRNVRGLTRTTICAAFSEMYRRDRDKAADFRDSLFQVDGPVQQARVLRDYVIRSARTGMGGGAATADMFRRATYAMIAHLEAKEIKLCRTANWPTLAVPVSLTEESRRSEVAVRAAVRAAARTRSHQNV